jgi:acyl dehydratase
MSLLTPELRARIGESASYTAPEELGRASFRYFGLAVGDYNPLYVDVAAAQAAGLRDVMAPPTLITETNQYMRGPRNDEGFMGHGWGIEIENTRLVRGGNEYEFVQPVHPDDVITATWTIADMTERRTSKGHDMLIITSRATYTNQRGERLASNTETLIFTSLDPTPDAAASEQGGAA